MTDLYALGTFSRSDEAPWPGVVRAGKVATLAQVLGDIPPDLQTIIFEWDRWRDLIDAAVSSSAQSVWQDESIFTAHLPYMPENLFGAGANYRRHVVEMLVDTGMAQTAEMTVDERRQHAEDEMDRRAASGNPFIWVGLRSAIAGPDAKLVLPPEVTQPDWELELAAIIGRTAYRVSPEEALDYVAGYTIANDITARERVYRKDLGPLGMDWMGCKSSPGFKILGPYITPAKFLQDPQTAHIRLSLNDQVMQDEGADDMIFGVAKLISFASTRAELRPGDIIMTGSPSGNGTHYNRFLQDGDIMRGEIDGLVGAQIVRCVAE